MKFDPRSPFPSMSPESVPYELVKQHAADFDSWLGLQIEANEESLRARVAANLRNDLASSTSSSSALIRPREYWFDKPAATFLTPYWDLDFMLANAQLRPNDLVIDLGAGYARLAFVIALKYSGVGFLGVEKIGERMELAERAFDSWRDQKKVQRGQFQFLVGDLTELSISSLPDPFGSESKTVLERARTHFFLYDFGSREDISCALVQLRDLSQHQKLNVLARGGRCREIIDRDCAWLSQVNKPEHFVRFSIYRS